MKAGILRRLGHPAGERGQGSLEYAGAIIAAGLLVIVLIVSATGFGRTISDGMEKIICEIFGNGSCEVSDPDAEIEPCLVSGSTDTSSVSAGVSLRYVDLGGGVERAIITEKYADGSATFTVVDRAELEAALAGRGGGAQFGGSGGSLSAGLAAVGALETADVYETDNAEQTADIEEKLADPGLAENILRSAGELRDGALDAPADIACGGLGLVGVDCPDVRPSDLLPNPEEAFSDFVFGDQDLPEADSEYVGGDVGIKGTLEASIDQPGALPGQPGSQAGSAEGELSGEVRTAEGARVYTEGDREGETEVYYELEGEAKAGFDTSLFGGAQAGADGALTATLTIGADGQPKTITLTATGTVTGEENLGEGELLTDPSLRDQFINSDSAEGSRYEIETEIDISDPSNLARVAQLLSTDPGDQADGVDALTDIARDDAEVTVNTYDYESNEDSSGFDFVVASGEASESSESNVLRSQFRKPRGSLDFTQTPCGTEPGP